MVESKYKGKRGGWSDLGAEPSNWSAFGRGEFPGTSFGTSSNYTETSGVKSGSARSPKGGGRGGEAME